MADTVLVIGGTGSLGQKLVERLLPHGRVVVFSRDEHKQFHMKNRLSTHLPGAEADFYIGDLKDRASIESVLLKVRPTHVINTAALKHVAACENNPIESVNVNVLGHHNLISAVRAHGGFIRSLVYTSTDKACRPVNIYGMCKAISEQLYTSFAQESTGIKTVVTRYGNVVNSNGSALPFFKSLLESGVRDLPITSLEMTRFFMTLDQAADVVQYAMGQDCKGGTIVVPWLDSYRVTDVASVIAGHVCPKEPISFNEIGVRQGEKLHEELLSTEEIRKTDRIGSQLMSYEPSAAVPSHNGPWEAYSSDKYLVSDKALIYKLLLDGGVISG